LTASARAARLAAGAWLALLAAAGSALAAEDTPASALFGAVGVPSPDHPPAVIGGYARGCIAGAVPLPADGPGWQVMRPSRNRAWGHPSLVDFVERLAAAARADGWPGLLVGDMGQPRGGPMSSGHASHQIGLDVDVWLTPMPGHTLTRDEREGLSAVSMLRDGAMEVDPARFGRGQATLVRRAALFPEVERIFVNPAIKKVLCESAGADRDWLAKVRPWYGHDDHMHVRLRCPADQPLCRDQDPPPAGDGCGAELAWWFGPEPYQKGPAVPAKPVTLADLPPSCTGVLREP
jgi:penicillin-insensitive murein endopeptidase